MLICANLSISFFLPHSRCLSCALACFGLATTVGCSVDMQGLPEPVAQTVRDPLDAGDDADARGSATRDAHVDARLADTARNADAARDVRFLSGVEGGPLDSGIRADSMEPPDGREADVASNIDVADGFGGSDVIETGGADGSVDRTGGGDTDGSGDTGGASPDPDLVLWYAFDEDSGTVATDSSRSSLGTHDGNLATFAASGNAGFSDTKRAGSHALSLTPSRISPYAGGGYVAIPPIAALAPDALTLAMWVNLNATGNEQNWERIVDFGSGPLQTSSFYLTARAAGSSAATTPVRFSMSRTVAGVTTEERLQGKAPLDRNVWHHIAVVLPSGSSYRGVLYIDGQVAATNNAMSMHAAQLDATPFNWIGRSQYPTDPFFDGLIDDFRIYRRAPTELEIEGLVAAR